MNPQQRRSTSGQSTMSNTPNTRTIVRKDSNSLPPVIMTERHTTSTAAHYPRGDPSAASRAIAYYPSVPHHQQHQHQQQPHHRGPSSHTLLRAEPHSLSPELLHRPNYGSAPAQPNGTYRYSRTHRSPMYALPHNSASAAAASSSAHLHYRHDIPSRSPVGPYPSGAPSRSTGQAYYTNGPLPSSHSTMVPAGSDAAYHRELFYAKARGVGGSPSNPQYHLTSASPRSGVASPPRAGQAPNSPRAVLPLASHQAGSTGATAGLSTSASTTPMTATITTTTTANSTSAAVAVTNSESDIKTITVWGHEETKLLVTLRNQLNWEFVVKKRNKVLWQQIAQELRKASYDKTWVQCQHKWKNMARVYKETSDYNVRVPLREQRACPFHREIKSVLEYTNNARKETKGNYPKSSYSLENAPIEEVREFFADLDQSTFEQVVQNPSPAPSVRSATTPASSTSGGRKRTREGEDSRGTKRRASVDYDTETQTGGEEDEEEEEEEDDDDNEEVDEDYEDGEGLGASDDLVFGNTVKSTPSQPESHQSLPATVQPAKSIHAVHHHHQSQVDSLTQLATATLLCPQYYAHPLAPVPSTGTLNNNNSSPFLSTAVLPGKPNESTSSLLTSAVESHRSRSEPPTPVFSAQATHSVPEFHHHNQPPATNDLLLAKIGNLESKIDQMGMAFQSYMNKLHETTTSLDSANYQLAQAQSELSRLHKVE
ncbi:hypothetical protein H4R33_003861 [Dimargaris cristalligena]|uniref:Myb-like domain-containing protein n=1 Tax=Dimargaris cristalligena TaxID=215637 RepID=A0A4Q0A2J1_9FUNG|nr:hypothetical protein H4R33_003861 [Dimargaris cristalligena]RKP40333.1 hypothetical protein BJ085DRAFT_29984 [Dimargaris cristalligena]|eukprot:RKP40333.1 hypothetical protein BJ085DRAFT_29984 [Dimargaris cristalligena]